MLDTFDRRAASVLNTLIRQSGPVSRRRRAVVGLVFGGLEWVFLVLVGRYATHGDVMGVTGAVAAVLAMVAGVAAGPLVGGGVALLAGVAFYVYIGDRGSTADLTSTTISVLVWFSVTVAVSLLAAQLRREVARREVSLTHALEAERRTGALQDRLVSSLVPSIPPVGRGFEVAQRYQPSEAGLRLSGDFVDVVEIDQRSLAFVVGDVTGHGPDAAALGATLRAAWQALVRTSLDVGDVVSSLEAVLERERSSPDMLATVGLGWFDGPSRMLSLVLAGHPAPVVASAGSVVPLQTTSVPPLGAWDDIDWTPTQTLLPASFDLLAFTDGIVERRTTEGHRFDEARLAELLSHECVRDGDAGLLLDRVLDGLLVRQGSRYEDDAAALLIRYRRESDDAQEAPLAGALRTMAARSSARPGSMELVPHW